MRLSKLAQGIQTSPILTLAAEINSRIAAGEKFYNLTVGDFNPKVFPVPDDFTEQTIRAYKEHETNYPGAKGIAQLRDSIAHFIKHFGNLDYPADNILISSGARPLIYAAYAATVEPGDNVVFPVPSWNNDYYTYLFNANPVIIETGADSNFMPSPESIKAHIQDARLIALCSPLNPTGTVLSREGLSAICEMVIAENKRRGDTQRPLYVLFDQIYWLLTFGDTQHYNAVDLYPEMRPYAIFIDGMSKAFAATGVRLGWGYGPDDLMAKMRSLIAHIGAWAPRAEQVAAGRYLADIPAVTSYLDEFRSQIRQRLDGFYKGFKNLEAAGHPVFAIEPQAAMYLTVKLDLKGKTTADGKQLDSQSAVHRYILDEAKVGLVPFSYFGASENSPWYRLSVGTCRLPEVEEIISSLGEALRKLR